MAEKANFFWLSNVNMGGFSLFHCGIIPKLVTMAKPHDPKAISVGWSQLENHFSCKAVQSYFFAIVQLLGRSRGLRIKQYVISEIGYYPMIWDKQPRSAHSALFTIWSNYFLQRKCLIITIVWQKLCHGHNWNLYVVRLRSPFCRNVWAKVHEELDRWRSYQKPDMFRSNSLRNS